MQRDRVPLVGCSLWSDGSWLAGDFFIWFFYNASSVKCVHWPVFLSCITVVHLYFCDLLSGIKPFTVPACKISGLNDSRTHLQTVYFPVLWHICCHRYAFLWKSFTCRCEGLRVSNFALFYWSFSSDIRAVKGLIKKYSIPAHAPFIFVELLLLLFWTTICKCCFFSEKGS